MNYRNREMQINEEIKERYELVKERILEIASGENTVKEPYGDYFSFVSGFMKQVFEVAELSVKDTLKKCSLEELKKYNHDLYADIMPMQYERSYANPDYAVEKLGEGFGQVFSFLYTELRGTIAYAYEMRLFDITIACELFVEIYNLMQEMDEDTLKSIKSAIRYYVSDYTDVTLKRRLLEMINEDYSFAVDIIENEDLSDLRYLYLLGEPISENEVRIAEYLNQMSEEEIDAMARTYTEGFRMGYENYKIDLSKKKTVTIRYNVGFERMVKAAIKQFETMGLKTTIYRAAVSSVHKGTAKIGFQSTNPNPQYDYDHRYDNALYLNKAFCDRKLAMMKVAYEEEKVAASEYAGPAVIEVFGENPFNPESKESVWKLSEKQQGLALDYQRESSVLTNQYIKGDEISFTIIAYPIPEIGDQFEEIFRETVKVNTLDMDKYQVIQEKIIAALDQGQYVTITGRGANKTRLTIQLPKLLHPEKETNFENCLADVNIPVGEVFTSPKLEGSNGLLHVTESYLKGLNYKDLKLTFEDGKISDYTCGNFENEAENRKYIKENLMHQHETLPIGEFAIGTNTTAYVMGKKYGISDLLPILIAEKTGPHFAVGDTCFRMGEDMRTYNPDGKEMKAKDNSCSILRKTDMSKAYFNCHTDITIPYDELGDIIVHKEDGSCISIIEEGRFVLEGTEELNVPLKELQ